MHFASYSYIASYSYADSVECVILPVYKYSCAYTCMHVAIATGKYSLLLTSYSYVAQYMNNTAIMFYAPVAT